MKRQLNKIFFLFFLLSTTVAKAQYSFSGTTTVTATVGTVISLSVTSNSAYSFNFNSITAVNSGITLSNVNSFSIKTNVNWQLAVSTTTAFFSGTGTWASTNMPASILQVWGTNANNKKILSTTAQTFQTGNRGNTSTSGNTFSMSMSANPGYDYGPGSYTITVMYTLSSQ